ncbi:MAG TPA: hypothetical protein VEK55_03945, partial [Xanthobacteraceae bacterium]|nr:hypothetical protein [Xanthobacteraceae bacterium]
MARRLILGGGVSGDKPPLTQRRAWRSPGQAPRERAQVGKAIMKLVMAIIKPFKLDEVRDALTGV